MKLEEYLEKQKNDRAAQALAERSEEADQDGAPRTSGHKKRKRQNTLALFLMFICGILVGGILFFGGSLLMHQEQTGTDAPSYERADAAVAPISAGGSKLVMSSEEDLEGLRMSSHAEQRSSETDSDGTSDTDSAASDAGQESEVPNFRPAAATQEDLSALGILQASLENGDGTRAALRKVFRDPIMVIREGRYYFFPVKENLSHNGYTADSYLISTDGKVQYQLANGSYARRGVDVSKYQGDIDWAKVRADGIDFAIIRAGIRGYGSGKLVPEENFVQNATAASAQGMEIGAYFFSQAITEEEAVEEADTVIQELSGYEISYPIVYDLERVSDGRMRALSRDEMTANCLAFCNRVKEAGYTPMIYGNMETFLMLLDLEQLQDIDKWLAYYNDDFYYPYDYVLWQYTEEGHVNGIEGDVDLNLDLRVR